MRITPLDVRKQEFRRVVRGLDADEVYAFLTTVADEYEAVLSDNKQLREKVIDLDEKVSEYRNMETTLRDTLLTAERVMSEARQNARKEAELILRDASVRASEQTASISSQVDKLKGQLRELRGQRDSFLARLQSLAESQIGLAESYRRDFEREERGEIESERVVASPPIAAPVPDPIPETESSIPKAEDLVPELARHSEDDSDREPTHDHDSIPTPSTDSNSPSGSAPSTAEATVARPSPAAEPQDHWRGYEVGMPSRGEPQPRHHAPKTEPQAVTTEDEGVEAAVELALDTEPDRREEPAPTEEIHAAERVPAPPVETRVEALPAGSHDPSREDPIDRVARMMAEAAGDDAVHPGGQDGEPVASSSAPEETEAAEESDDDHSRWSLSRFTKGLSNF